jgi:hypothetical protein
MIPLYRAGIPPSVLYIVTKVCHIPGSLALCVVLKAAKEADWIDKRVLTMSSGYVKHTEVMPAAPPHIKRRRELKSWPGEASKNFKTVSSDQDFVAYNLGKAELTGKNGGHLFVEIITSELHGRVGYNSNAVGAIAPHKAAPPLIFPHFHETFSNGELVLFSANALYLE